MIAGNYLFEVVIVYSGIRQGEMSGKLYKPVIHFRNKPEAEP